MGVLVFERSASLFKQTCGERPSGLFVVSVVALVAAPLVMVGAVVGSASALVVTVTSIGVVLAGMLFVFLLSQTTGSRQDIAVRVREGW